MYGSPSLSVREKNGQSRAAGMPRTRGAHWHAARAQQGHRVSPCTLGTGDGYAVAAEMQAPRPATVRFEYSVGRDVAPAFARDDAPAPAGAAPLPSLL